MIKFKGFAHFGMTFWVLLLAFFVVVSNPARAQMPANGPSMAINLNGIADWSTQHAFIDIAKTARPWFGHMEGRWGGISNEQLRSMGHVNEDGWPVSIPTSAVKLGTVFFTDQPVELNSIRGRYRITYEGDVDIELSGVARNIRYRDGEIWFDYPEGTSGLIAINLTRINPQAPLTSLAIVHEDNIPLFEIGAIFNPNWLDRIKDFRVLRFMSWMKTNHSKVETWDDLPTTNDFSYTDGVPLDLLIRLSNLIGADPWFTLPHMADDALVERFGETAKSGLYPNRKAYFEYSNEIWNFQFDQTKWAREQASELWENRAGGNAWIQFAGLRAMQIGQILKDVYADQADERLINVVGVHTGSVGLADTQLEGDLLRRELKTPPSDIFDAYAVTGYLRPDFGDQNTSQIVARWHANGGKENVFRMLDQTIRDTRLTFLREKAWPAHRARADKHGLDLIMYEGGTHVIVPYHENVRPEHVEMFTEFNYSPLMDALYQDTFETWRAAGGGLFNAFVDIYSPAKWGSWGHLRHLDDDTGRWDVLLHDNQRASNYEASRDSFDFAQGVYSNLNTPEVTGTELDDILVGSTSDELFIPTMGNDMMHGGGGFDQLLLSGKVSDYTFHVDGERVRAESDEQNLWFADIDYVVFPEEGLAINPDDLR